MFEIDDKKEACGIIAVINHKNAAPLCATGLFSLQHRGEEACGITAFKDGKLLTSCGLGLVNKVFENENFSQFENFRSAIGHTRYSVTGSSEEIKNIQPLSVQSNKGSFALAHNGNLINSKELRDKLESDGAIFQGSTDTEIFLHLIARSKKSFREAFIDACKQVKGAYSLVAINQDGIYAVKDPNGFKPICYGLLKQKESIFAKDEGSSYVIASETPALDLMDATYIDELEPGEMLFISHSGAVDRKNIFSPKKEAETKKCIFELIYFSRPDSHLFKESVYVFRKKLGHILAREGPVKADMVIPIPDSGNISALGYAEETGIPLEKVLTKNHYTSRSFIQPKQNQREMMVKMKLNPIANMIKGKKVVLVDDSIVRGTTTREKIKAFRQCGAKEIHLRIASARIKYPCFYGINFPNVSELIANKMTLEETKNFLGLDSLVHLSIEGMLKASEQSGFCLACFNGNYPVS